MTTVEEKAMSMLQKWVNMKRDLKSKIEHEVMPEDPEEVKTI